MIYHVTATCGKKRMTVVVITNINTTKFVTLEFADEEFIAQKATNQLNIL